MIRTPLPPSWLPEAMTTGQLEIVMRVRPLPGNPRGYGRILSLASGSNSPNLYLGQFGGALVLGCYSRLDRLPPESVVVVRGALASGRWYDLEVVITPGEMRLAVDGAQAGRCQLPAGLLAGWSPDAILVLANRPSGDQGWWGEITRCVVRCSDATVDYADETRIELPPTFLAAHFVPRWTEVVHLSSGVLLSLDAAANFLAFLPVGAVIALVGVWRGSAWRALLICSLASLGVEVTQLLFEDCFPSLSDWLLNSAGGGLGGFLARRTLWPLDRAAAGNAALGSERPMRHRH